MTTKYMIGEQKVIERGNLNGKQPVIEYVPSEYWGVHDSSRSAKVRYVTEMDPATKTMPDDWKVKQFDRWRANNFAGGAKILKVQVEAPAAVAQSAAYVRSYAQPGLLADEDGAPLFSMA